MDNETKARRDMGKFSLRQPKLSKQNLEEIVTNLKEAKDF